MDQIAIISDIHGNLPAFEAVLEDIQKRHIETIYCLGDLVGKGPDSAKVVDICHEVCQIVVKGNWEDEMTKPMDRLAGQWRQRQLGQERLAYLRSLPHTIDFQMSGKQVRLFHASAQGIHHRVGFWSEQNELERMFENTTFTTDTYPTPDVVGYGDIHHAYLLPVAGKILFNVGSVGNPMDYMPLAGYVIFSGRLHYGKPAPLNIEIVRLPYDIKRALQDARAVDMPKLAEYEFELRTANHRSHFR